MSKIIKYICCFSVLITSLCLYNINTSSFAFAQEPTFSSKAYCLMDFGTGEVLKENNADKTLPIASVTKTMTMLLTLEAIQSDKLKWEQNLIASKNASGMGGSQVFIDENSNYSVKNLMIAIAVSSANDASVMIAEELGGSEEGFVKLMNEKANVLGLKNTNYENCTGLPSNNHYSCARDVAIIMKNLLSHKEYYEICGIKLQDFLHPSGRVTQMSNTNKLLKNYKGCDAGKTGSTNEAGYCLSASAKRNNMRLIGVVLGAENSKVRFNECSRLFDWGFANFESQCLLDATTTFNESIKIARSNMQEIPIKSAKDYWVLTMKGEKSNKELHYEYDKDLKAPIKIGDRVGQVIVTENNVVLEKIDLISLINIDLRNFADSIKILTENWKIK